MPDKDVLTAIEMDKRRKSRSHIWGTRPFGRERTLTKGRYWARRRDRACSEVMQGT